MAADIHQSTISMESVRGKKSSPFRKRRMILHTCTVSILTTVERASLNATKFCEPVGFLINRFIKSIPTRGLIVCLYQFQTYLILACMSFVDDWILKVENVVEDHFPSSSYVFDKIDDVVCYTECFPAKVDVVVDKVSRVANKFHVRDGLWKILDLVILLRYVFIAWWGSEFGLTKEKDIMVDKDCSENCQSTRMVVCDEAVCQIKPSMISQLTSLPEKNHNLNLMHEPDKRTMQDEQEFKEEPNEKIRDEDGMKNNIEEHVPKCSYKEVLEKGNNNMEVLEKGNSYKEVLEKGNSCKEVFERKSSYKEILERGTKDVYKEQNEETTKEESCEQTEDNNYTEGLKIVDGRNDPILDLFESAWHMT